MVYWTYGSVAPLSATKKKGEKKKKKRERKQAAVENVEPEDYIPPSRPRTALHR